jgi:hypothetical protein
VPLGQIAKINDGAQKILFNRERRQSSPAETMNRNLKNYQ